MMQHAENQQVTAKGCRGNGAERAETGKCDPKKFFFVKFTRSVCEDGVVPSGIGLEGVIGTDLMCIVSVITVPRCRSLLLVE